jgi:tetratricopeptide (TPR) repeat protein
MHLIGIEDPARASFTSWLYRPYIDLTPVDRGGNPQVPGLLYALASVEESTDYPRLHAVYPPSLREAIVREARLPEYHLQDPLALPGELRTSHWERLCAYLAEFSAIATSEQARVLWLLHRMHLHHAILRYAPAPARDELGLSESLAQIAFMRGMARLALYQDGEGELDTSELELVANGAPPGQWAVIEATYLLAAVAAKTRSDVNELQQWLAQHRRQIELARADEHTDAKLRSRYHRVYAFVPQLSGDLSRMTEEMERATEWAEMMRRDTAEEEAESNVLACALWESRAKEALLHGDLELAEERVRRYVSHAPLDPQAHLDLGQVLVERGELNEAVTAYRAAALCGPPGTEVAWFMLGQCWEQLDEPEAARDAYLAALDLDPLGVASLEQLVSVARSLGDSVVVRWAEERLNVLGTADPDELLPYQRYEGALGSAG